MCGICGFNWEDKKLIKHMTDSIRHRGPDSDGFYTDRKVSMGIRRLRIIDLTTGDQPIFNEDKTKCIVFNGEVYNFKSLKEELIKKGHRFYTNTDTEVVLHSYEEYGKECVKYLRGMFAFAIWDSKNKSLFIARDRIGIKPLYYTIFKNNFIFASEIKSILQCRDFERRVNENALHYYLTFRYIPENLTMFEGLYKLLPGHTLTLHDNKLRIERYYDIVIGDIKNEGEEYFANKLLELIKESIKLRLISDVPFGAYLSGGLDSSSLVAVMQSFLKEPVKTFSVGFQASEPFNELKYASLVAKRFGTDHYEVIVEPDDIKLLPEVIWHLDDPVANPAILISQYKLSQLAKKKVSMVLVGEGADELFAGYAEFKINKLSNSFRYIPKFIRKNILAQTVDFLPQTILNKLFRYSAYFGSKLRERLKEFIINLDDNEKSYLILREFFSDDEKKELFSNEFFENEKRINYYDLLKPYFSKIKTNFLDSLILTDMKKRLPNFLLHEVDKMTMAHGLEARVPFIDHKLVEFSFTLPPNLKLKGTNVKYILKKAVSKTIPNEILKRKKHPFTNPVDGNYARVLKDIALNTLDNSEIYKNYFKRDKIKGIIENYNSSPMYYYRQLSSIVTLDIWHKIYIEQDNFKNPNLNLNKLY
tara:strand:- start:2258 stop:4195 length:1938 start_codon:yes stop_codon:yes gene_type:complete